MVQILGIKSQSQLKADCVHFLLILHCILVTTIYNPIFKYILRRSRVTCRPQSFYPLHLEVLRLFTLPP